MAVDNPRQCSGLVYVRNRSEVEGRRAADAVRGNFIGLTRTRRKAHRKCTSVSTCTIDSINICMLYRSTT